LAIYHLVIGGFGFIGNILIERLLHQGEQVICIDDNSSGNFHYSEKKFSDCKNLDSILGDINDESIVKWLSQKIGDNEVVVWHLAANSDIQSGSILANLDAQKTFMTSVTVCNLIADLNVQYVNFASTSAVYGESKIGARFTEESPCVPISFYGTAKQASEKFLEIKSRNSRIPLLIFRFANIVGIPATHGVLFDFIKQLQNSPESLTVLGDGNQTKSYLHVGKLVEMMLGLWRNNQTGIYNLGPGDMGVNVREIAELLVAHLKDPIKIQYGTSERGWDGDAVRALMSTDKYESIFKTSRLKSRDAIHQAIHEISQQLDLQIYCPDLGKAKG
jgi:UDP-glucose 4-epimerase